MPHPQQNVKDDRKKSKEFPTVSQILSDGAIVEMLYQPKTRSTVFVVWRKGEWSLEKHVDVVDGTRLVPFSPDNNLIKNEAAKLLAILTP